MLKFFIITILPPRWEEKALIYPDVLLWPTRVKVTGGCVYTLSEGESLSHVCFPQVNEIHFGQKEAHCNLYFHSSTVIVYTLQKYRE